MITMLTGDCREVLRTLPDASVHCVVTSPPYWGLRDYGVAGQLGMEPDFNAYVAAMVGVFREVRRVLCDDGTLWLNLGDTYSSGNRDYPQVKQSLNGPAGPVEGSRRAPVMPGLKPKDLCGIPWRVAFALQADGWYLRQDIIWSKPNPMPESVTDRCTKAHEYLFLLSKRERYYYDGDAISEEGSGRTPGNRSYKYDGLIGHETKHGILAQANIPQMTRNKRSVWEVTTAPFSEAHFATFPPALIEPCIKAGTSEKGCCGQCGKPWVRQTQRTEPTYWEQRKQHDFDGRKADNGPNDNYKSISRGRPDNSGVGYNHSQTIGWSPSCACAADPVPCTVLDPFAGAGTTGLVADRLQRNAILIELNPQYSAMAGDRITGDAPLFVELT